MKSLFFRRKKYDDLSPDEIFLDAKNVSRLDSNSFEGYIEKPLSKRMLSFVAFCIIVGMSLLIGKLFSLQIIEGSVFAERSRNNTFISTPLFGERGAIYDRNGTLLVWNVGSTTLSEVSRRTYASFEGLAPIVGFVKYPQKDSKGNYWRTEYVGVDGVEKIYDDVLRGINGKQIIEVDAFGNQTDTHITNMPVAGDNIILTIDAEIQNALYKEIEKAIEQAGFTAGAGVMMDVETGEVIALVSVPSFSMSLLNNEKGNQALQAANSDPRKPFLDRAISGLYSPGSTVKPFMALAALEEDIISPFKSIESRGFITVRNPFGGPDTIFRDWRVHGYTDMRQAIAVSSDVYFYAIGGGYADQKGMGIANIDKYMRMYGFATTTGIDLPGEAVGIIPNPEWKQRVFKEAWRLGNTYHTSIGQYGFQVSPIQLTRSVASIANGGRLVVPHVVQNVKPKTKKEESSYSISAEDAKVIREGMRLTVTAGSATSLNNVGFEVAAKTGTAEIGVRKGRVHSWMSGYFPYNNPRYAFVIVLENGPTPNSYGAGRVSYEWLRYIAREKPGYVRKEEIILPEDSSEIKIEEETVAPRD